MAKPQFMVTYHPEHLTGVGQQVRETFNNESGALARADQLLHNPNSISPAIRVNGHHITGIQNLEVHRIDTIRTYRQTFK